jgi:hypothetical protein
MPRRVSLIILLGLVIVLVLAFGISAIAQTGGGPAAALSLGAGQLGKPHVEATDGPNTFSCTGLMRFLLRNSGGPTDAPWDPYGYLAAYPARQGPAQAGDVVVGQGYVGMATGDGNVLMSNLVDGKVEYAPISVMEPIAGVVNPWGGTALPASGGNTLPASGGTALPATNPAGGNLAPVGGDATGGSLAPAGSNPTGTNPAGSN